MARNLLKRYNNVEEYNTVKCTLEFGTISLINNITDGFIFQLKIIIKIIFLNFGFSQALSTCI